MMKKLIVFLLAFVLSLPTFTKADEGMWLPLLIKRLNEVDMQKEGLKLTAEEIYSVNNACLKDAIISLGGFCTAEVVSADGLLLTNHHCGYDAVASLSTVENDILTKGFFAMSRDQEKAAEGLTATFLVRMEDVTDKIKAVINDTMSEDARTIAITSAYKKLKDDNSENGRYKVDVKSFFKGNEFYLFVYEVFKDVRLVGTPPSAIGKFGGDTDNWMWPRHTGDFSMFRIYMSADGKPAEYAKSNIPYHAKHFLPINIGGFKKDDYAMIMGYPGQTDRYLTSFGVELAVDQTSPAIVKIRTQRLKLMKEDMEASDAVRLKYASDYANVSNYWKYFIGQTKGLKRMRTADQKRDIEKKFDQWANSSPDLKKKFGNVVANLGKAYGDMRTYAIARTYLMEGIFGTQILPFAYSYQNLEQLLSNKDAKPEDIKKEVDQLKNNAEEHFKDYNAPTDEKITAALLKLYANDVPKNQQAPLFAMIQDKYKGDFKKYAEELFEHSIFTDKDKTIKFLADPSLKKLQKDKTYSAVKEIFDHYNVNVRANTKPIQARIDKNMRLFVEGLRMMDPNKKFYPDANGTMRVSYGKIADYEPMDGVHYSYYTTIEGVMEKMDNSNEEFIVPAKQEELYKKKDYGRYAENGTLPVCFLTTNDITGGNSGSPVMNGKGELIGLAFDGNWEAMSGDIDYDETYKRTICVDSRYVLWCIDKLMGATNVINELKIVN